jgi:polar amino acid transport system substrate-binding protein
MISRRALLLSAAGLLASRPGAAADEVRGKPLVLAVGLSLPPYVIADKRRGMEYDIVKEALALAGYELVPRFVDFGDGPRLLREGYVDGAMTMQPESGVDAHYSAVYITYRNHAMTLGARGLRSSRMEDLAGKSILAFENARHYLGPEFARVTAGNAAYREVAEQYRQNLELLAGKVDVVVADRNIFHWYARDPRVTRAANARQPITYHDIFAPTPYRIGFRHAATRDAFDGALARLEASGRRDAILRAYTSAS